jgi:exosome complex RNA-binding protein Rrp42 (RNase PH superfamily)
MYGLIVWYFPSEVSRIDWKILSSDVPQPLDASSLAVRIALQTSLLPHITLEDVPVDRTYEERASLMDIQKGRIPHEERVFQVDDDWVLYPVFQNLAIG